MTPPRVESSTLQAAQCGRFVRLACACVVAACLILASPGAVVAAASADSAELRSYLTLTPDALAARIDTSGAFKDSDNFRLKAVATALAENYERLGNESDAERVLAILERYAEVIPEWPLISARTGRAEAVDSADFTQWDRGGFWGAQWMYVDLDHAVELTEAWQKIKQSRTVLGRGPEGVAALRARLADSLFGHLVDVNLQFYSKPGRDDISFLPFSNMDPARLQGLSALGREWNPDWVHIAHKALQSFPRVGFFKDRFWQEGSFSYHRQLVRQLGWLVDALEGHSDPVGYEFSGYVSRFGRNIPGTPGRFDNLDPALGIADELRRIRRVLSHLVFPDNSIVALHDTHAYQKHEVRQPLVSSVCLHGLRHCILHRSRFQSHNVAHLHYGGTDGHEQSDALNLVLWRNGRELMSEGGYRKTGTLAFNRSVWGHNTVVVNGRDQNTRHHRGEEITPDEHKPDYGLIPWQDEGHGNTNNQGDLLYADLGNHSIQAVAASAPRSYTRAARLRKYERALLAVPLDDARLEYFVDVFRVEGGRLHEWLMHGDLGRDHEIAVAAGKASTMRQEKNGLEMQKRYRPDAPWTSTVRYPDVATAVTTHHLNPVAATVLTGTGPGQRRKDKAPYLKDRRISRSTTFVKLHDFESKETSGVRAKMLRPAANASEAVLIEVAVSDTRRDLVLMQTASARREITMQLTDTAHIRSNALIAVVTLEQGRPDSVYVLGGVAHLDNGRGCSRTVSSESTQLMNVRQVQSHPAQNMVVTDADGGVAKPGFPLNVRLPNGVVESSDVIRIERGDTTKFVLFSEPGYEYDRDTGTVQQTFYPGRRYTGTIEASQSPAVQTMVTGCR